MVWSVADEKFQENLEAAKAYYEDHWSLCAPRSAVALDRPVGQWLSNLRRAGALEGHPEWETALQEIDPDWNPEWPADWQRHFAAVRELLRDEDQTDVLPGMTIHGQDVGRWLNKQRQHATWAKLAAGQRERLEQLGITPLAPPAEAEAPVKAAKAPLRAFELGMAALTQYKARTGSVTVPRGHVETIAVDGQEHAIKLGVWAMNLKGRREKLTSDKLRQLSDLGLAWAAEEAAA